MSRKRGARGKRGKRERVVTVSHPPLRTQSQYRLSGKEQGLTRGTQVMTTGKGGLAMGTIVSGPHEHSTKRDDTGEKLGQLVRIASDQDLRAQAEAEARKDQLLRKTLRLIRDRKLPLRIIELFVQGAGGDINPISYKDVNHLLSAEPLVLMLGLSTLRAVRKIETKPDQQLIVHSESLKLPRADYTMRIAEMEEEREKLAGSLRGTFLNLDTFLPLATKYSLAPDFPSLNSYRYL